MSHHCLVVNRQYLNSLLLFVGREKVSKNPYEIKVRGLVSLREGVTYPKRLWYSEGASCLLPKDPEHESEATFFEKTFQTP